ncbi:hypothetical protein L195_g038054 [Trifolium pratense]|uniref:NHL domain-containing protein n=2 Tax=Trifolium pratense TaxID=57577 RepID=A0A2K3LU25_TRIPR|nr:hypothetical protein L195_g038054 [Trifolium pratense]CAJ2664391.1 unnamed protein product [Trifolium pratense]
MSVELELESESTSPTAHLQQRSTRALCFPTCFASRRSSIWWERVRSASFSQSHPTTTADRWWSRGLKALKKLRDWSEIVAGPRWKTFIRKFNHHRSSRRMANSKYQYDPSSYALNFDEGQNEFSHDEGFHNFSTRYAAVNVKSVAPEPNCEIRVLV